MTVKFHLYLVRYLDKSGNHFIVVIYVPFFLVSSYQKTFATGIYSVSYFSEESTCHFEMISEEILRGDCELHFTNQSNKDVEFTIEFYEALIFKDDLPVVSLMNADAPYEIKLGKKESKHVKMETNIDVSDMANHIEGGGATGVNIIMRSNGKNRNL